MQIQASLARTLLKTG